MNETVKRAVEILRNGGVLLYPTDTVWGIGCDATNADAVARVFRIKAREDSKSLVVLAKDVDMVCRYVKEIPEIALQLIEVNDKPMTIIYPDAIVDPVPEACSDELGNGTALTGNGAVGGTTRNPSPARKSNRSAYGLAQNVVAEDGSAAIRIPLGGFCLDLVRAFGRPLVSTSANISGGPTPKCFSEISAAIRSAVDYIVDPVLEAGATGKASSIIKIFSDSSIQILRK